MKVEINNKEQNTEIKFPCLMSAKNGEIIVLMIEKKKGTAIAHPFESFGFYCETWLMEEFIPFNGSITLSNE